MNEDDRGPFSFGVNNNLAAIVNLYRFFRGLRSKKFNSSMEHPMGICKILTQPMDMHMLTSVGTLHLMEGAGECSQAFRSK